MVSWEPWPLAGGGAATSEVGGAVSHKVTHLDPPSRRGHPLPRQAVNPGGVLAGQGAGAKAGCPHLEPKDARGGPPASPRAGPRSPGGRVAPHAWGAAADRGPDRTQQPRGVSSGVERA